MKKCIFFLMAAIVLPGYLLTADVAEMADGSKLLGTAKKLDDGTLIFSTSFAGDLRLDWIQVKSLETSNPALAELKPPQVEPPAPAEPEGRVWAYEIAADLAGKSGNTDKLDYGFQTTATLKGEIDQLKLSAAMRKEEVEGEKTVDNLTLSADYERQIDDRTNWYVRTEYLEDEFKGLDYRSTTAAGLGHYFLKEETHSLRTRAGLFYKHEEYDGSTEDGGDDSVGLDLGINHMIELGEWAKIVTDVKYLPSFEDIEDYDILHETALDVPIGGSAMWKLRMGIANEYDSQPPEDTEKLDTSYFVRLVLNWEQGKFLEASGLKRFVK